MVIINGPIKYLHFEMAEMENKKITIFTYSEIVQNCL